MQINPAIHQAAMGYAYSIGAYSRTSCDIFRSDDPTEGGHAWICDGYQFNNVIYYFHFNWGWSGAYDGYLLNQQLESLRIDF